MTSPTPGPTRRHEPVRTRVLVVDDEPSFREGLKVALEGEGFDVVIARDGAEALASFEADAPDIILLDVMLPRVSGIDVCRRIRSTSDVPIIMVSARREEIDMVVGLEVGADDYVSKPYRVRELVARMRTILRRAVVLGSTDSAPDTETAPDGAVYIDRDRHEVLVDGELVQLPLKEFDVLALLVDNEGLVVTRETLLDRVWGYDYVGDTKTLDVHIRRLRSKIEPDPSQPSRILTVRGVGYKFVS